MVIDGKKIAEEILERIKKEVAALPFQPAFSDVLVGDDPVSAQYVRMKAKTAERVGFKFRNAHFPGDIDTQKLIEEISKIGAEPELCGLIVQLPLPPSIEKQAVLDAIDPSIDVDCTGKTNMDLFYSGKAYMTFPTAAAVMNILDGLNLDFRGKTCLVIGRGQLVGKPVSFLLKERGANVVVAHSQTENIPALMEKADVIVSAVGKAKLVTGRHIKPGAVIVDAGTSDSDGGIVGDVDLESAKEIASAVSPTPGGVGPVTVAMLLQNVLNVAKARAKSGRR